MVTLFIGINREVSLQSVSRLDQGQECRVRSHLVTLSISISLARSVMSYLDQGLDQNVE